MTCLPRAADRTRTVLETTAVDNSNDWWTGLVQDRDPETGERRLRLERWKDNGGTYDNPHTWRVRPDFWGEERAAVDTFRQQGGRPSLTDLPIDDYLTPLEALRVRKDEVRWVEVVRVQYPQGYDKVRIYHWDPDDESTRQKWTVGRNWSQVQDVATRLLEAGA